VIVLDTHAWLWWCDSPRRLSPQAQREIEHAAAIGVSAMSCWELAMLDRQNRVRFDRGVYAWVRNALARERTVMLPVTAEIATRGAALQAAVADPADGLIYATAVEHHAKLVTRDARLRTHDPARVVW
jgi:PIN domain nuclease of toxin-antitoxin system